MNNDQRDEKLNQIHDAVTTMKARCDIREDQIKTLFDGYNQTNKNTVFIKAITIAGGAICTFLSSIVIWKVTK